MRTHAHIACVRARVTGSMYIWIYYKSECVHLVPNVDHFVERATHECVKVCQGGAVAILESHEQTLLDDSELMRSVFQLAIHLQQLVAGLYAKQERELSV